MATDAGAASAKHFRAGALWRVIVGLGSAAVAVALTAGVAEAWAAPQNWAASAGRGLAIAVISAGSFFLTAFTLRLGFVRAGVPADEPFVPDSAPSAVRSAWQRCSRSRVTSAAVALGIGLLVGLLTAGMDDGDDGEEQVAADRVVRLESGSTVAGKERTRGSGTESDAPGSETPSGGGEDTDGDGVPDGGSDGTGGSGDDGGGSASGSSGSGNSGGGSGGGGGGTTTTTGPGTDYPCDALDEYTGDVDELLESLGIDEDEITEETCDEIEEAIEDADETLSDILDELFGVIPIPIPSVTTTTATLPSVTTTTVTVPSLPVTTTTVTLPNLGL